MKVTLKVNTSPVEDSLFTFQRDEYKICIDFISSTLVAETVQLEGKTVALLTSGPDHVEIVQQINRLIKSMFFASVTDAELRDFLKVHASHLEEIGKG